MNDTEILDRISIYPVFNFRLLRIRNFPVCILLQQYQLPRFKISPINYELLQLVIDIRVKLDSVPISFSGPARVPVVVIAEFIRSVCILYIPHVYILYLSYRGKYRSEFLLCWEQPHRRSCRSSQFDQRGSYKKLLHQCVKFHQLCIL